MIFVEDCDTGGPSLVVVRIIIIIIIKAFFILG